MEKIEFKMKPKFKMDEVVSVICDGKVYTGKVFVIDNMPNGWRYDVIATKPSNLIIKHIDENKLR